ncbi:MAG: hypothetical protein Q7S74_04305 [Nanoarchaeota archaeon]|nr:hypothetical protein [Nanoarchaeota archaeon]
MGEMKIKINDGLEQVFRKVAMRRFGYHRGSMSKAAQEAFEQWTSIQDVPDHKEDPVEMISGLMKHVKKNSVELQHEAWERVGRKHAH